MLKTILAVSCTLSLAQFEGSPPASRNPAVKGWDMAGSAERTIFENIEKLQGGNLQQRGSKQLALGFPDVRAAMTDEGGEYTFFYPTPRAWRSFFQGYARKGKPVTKSLIHEVLKYHLLNKAVFTQDLVSGANIVRTMMQSPSFENVAGPQVLNVLKGAHPPYKVSFGAPSYQRFTSNIVMADVRCKNGVVHVVDKVLFFPAFATETLAMGGARDFLSAAASAALPAVLDGATNVTLFVPLNAALDAVLAKGDVGPTVLSDALLTHVAHGAHYSPGLSQLKDGITMFNGKIVDVVLEDHSVTVGGAKVVLADVLVRNGVLHVVDKLLTPRTPRGDAKSTPLQVQ